MGQAKKRGTFEERRQQAVAAEHAKLEAAWEVKRARQKEEQDRVDAMTEEERDAYFTKPRRRTSIAPFLLTSLAMASMSGGFGGRRGMF